MSQPIRKIEDAASVSAAAFSVAVAAGSICLIACGGCGCEFREMPPGDIDIIMDGDFPTGGESNSNGTIDTDGGTSSVAGTFIPGPALSGLPCLVCHKNTQGALRAVVDDTGVGTHRFSDADITAADCEGCHEMTEHLMGKVRLWKDPNDRSDVIVVNGMVPRVAAEVAALTPFCTTCHSDQLVHSVGGGWQPGCVDCHNVHHAGNDNAFLVRETIYQRTLDENAAVVFTDFTGDGSFSDSDPARTDGVCQVCHTETSYHTRDGGGVPHNEGQNCLVCHPHGAGFLSLGTAEVACISCHSAAQGTRPAIVDADGGGGHLLQGTMLTESDCLVCHEFSKHREGAVRLWNNPNSPSDVIELAGDPTVDTNEAAKLRPFCKECHTVENAHAVSGDWQPDCSACHSMHEHSSVNRSLVSSFVRNQTTNTDAAVTFTSRTGSGSFDDGQPGANDGICQVCHTSTTHHLADGASAPHFDGQDCTQCHSHSSGYATLGLDGQSCIDCHSLTQGTRPAVVTETGAGGHHFGSGVQTADDCVQCHEMSEHQAGVVRLWQNPNNPFAVIAITGDPFRDPAEANKLTPFCNSCHASTQNAVHTVTGTWNPACTACHRMHDAADPNLSLVNAFVHNLTLGVDKPVSFTSLTGAGSFDDGDPTLNNGICQVCHTTTTHHLHDGSSGPHNDAQDCTACHSHGSGFATNGLGDASCVDCHSTVQGTRPAVVDATGAGGHVLTGNVLSPADCEVCHDFSQHQSGFVRLWGDPNDPSIGNVIELTGDPATDTVEADKAIQFCQSCHPATTHGTHSVGGSWQPSCLGCHDMHNPDDPNLSHVLASIRNKTLGTDFPVSFTARTGPGSFDDGDPTVNDGVCQVCHTTTNYHQFDGGGTAHNEGTDCTACHSHASGFDPGGVGGLACMDCHFGQQGSRRGIVSEFDLSSHHVLSTLDDAACLVCHDHSQHQQGQVRLKNVDDPNNPAAVVTLTGDPMATLSEAVKLEPFCLACHDADGADGVAPFADGVMPPPIDAARWANASHNSIQTTCFGDGETFGCHSSGHGSMKAYMLAPWDAGQVSVPGDPLREEEGMCYACHDADGPASTDIQSLFASQTHHNVSSLDQIDGSRVECTDCHNPHEVNSASPLTNPNGGDPWIGTGENFCLVCHGGVAPPGIAFPPTSPGTGFNKVDFVGSVHDTQTGADSCRQCHNEHGSPHLAMLHRKYVVADFNQYSQGDGDYASCWDCHDETATVLQTNNFANRHKKHVKDEKSPCIICHNAHRPFDAGEMGLVDMDYPIQNGNYNIQFINGGNGSTSFWIDAAANKGFCLIRCHGENHDPFNYNRQ